MDMNAKTDAPLKIALIEPEARDVEWISEMMEIGRAHV